MSFSHSTPFRRSLFRQNTTLENTFAHLSFPTCSSNEFEHDMAYNSYLQSLMMQQIAERTIEKHEEEETDQLIIQKDLLFKLKKKIHVSAQELKQLSNCEDLNKVFDSLNNNASKFSQLNEAGNLSATVKQGVTLMETISKRIKVKNVQTENFGQKKSFDKLSSLIQKCSEVIEGLGIEQGIVEKVQRLAHVISEYEKILAIVLEKRETLGAAQSKALTKLLVRASNAFCQME